MSSRTTTTGSKVELLAHVELFEGCTKKELAGIATLCTEYDAPAGRTLARQGEPGAEFFIIVKGRATASRNDVVLAELSATNFFGELAILDCGPRTATVVAATDLHLLVLSRSEFKAVCRNYPSVSCRMLTVLGARLRRADDMIDAASHPEAPRHITV